MIGTLTLKEKYTVADANTIAHQIVAHIHTPHSRGIFKESSAHSQTIKP